MTPLLFALAVLCAGCGAPAPAAPPGAVVKTGAQVLVESGFAALDGMRVGLIVNHTARVGGRHLIDLIDAAPNVEIGALFGPEHGLRGDADAGETIADGRDERTGAPVFSLYGETRRPTPEMLDGLDALVFDIQDIGARFYTFISTMGLSMQSAAEAGLPFVVLDRPNPLGGVQMEGFVLDSAYTSFVGQYPVPITYGLTAGELARMIKGEQMLPGLETLDLRIIEMEGWERAMRWPATGLTWQPTSPNIPDFETALIYPGACFFEATTASEGRGTYEPFKQIGAPWADAAALADTLNARNLPGVLFRPVSFTPVAIEGMASNPKLKDVPVWGVHYVLTDAEAFRPVETGVHVLHAFYHQAPDSVKAGFLKKRWLDLLAGTDRLYEMLTAGAPPEAIVAAWREDVVAFRLRRAPYLLYD